MYTERLANMCIYFIYNSQEKKMSRASNHVETKSFESGIIKKKIQLVYNRRFEKVRFTYLQTSNNTDSTQACRRNHYTGPPISTSLPGLGTPPQTATPLSTGCGNLPRAMEPLANTRAVNDIKHIKCGYLYRVHIASKLLKTKRISLFSSALRSECTILAPCTFLVFAPSCVQTLAQCCGL